MDLFQYMCGMLQEIYRIVHYQAGKLDQLERDLNELKKKLTEQPAAPRTNIEKIEYNFEQLKVETLAGTLIIGVSGAIDDLSVEGQSAEDVQIGEDGGQNAGTGAGAMDGADSGEGAAGAMDGADSGQGAADASGIEAGAGVGAGAGAVPNPNTDVYPGITYSPGMQLGSICDQLRGIVPALLDEQSLRTLTPLTTHEKAAAAEQLLRLLDERIDEYRSKLEVAQAASDPAQLETIVQTVKDELKLAVQQYFLAKERKNPHGPHQA